MNTDKLENSDTKIKTTEKFTLIEILVVISIIAILMALLMPALGSVVKSADKTRAKEMANAIVTAIAEYEVEYSVPPEFTGMIIGSDQNKLDKTQYDTLVQILTCVDMPSPPAVSGAANSKDLANAREMQFLEPNNGFTTTGYLDPWDKRFVVLLDYDFDNNINLNGTDIQTNGRTLVYSCGPDGEDNNGGGDDICSWK